MAKRTQRKDVGAWLGGNRGTVQSRMPSGASDREAQADAGGGQMEQVRAELGLGAYAAGIGAAGAIGAGVAAVKSGAAARAVNKMTGQQVIVHGGKVRGLSQIDPRVPSNFPSGNRAVYGMNPEYAIRARGLPEPSPSRPLKLAEIANEYAEGGSAYVAKVPKRSITNPSSIGPKAKVAVVQSTSPAKVVAEIPLSGTSAAQLAKQQKDILKAAKRAGAKIPKIK